MKILKAEYTASAVRLDQCPESGEPEIALVGRSNVGKSSFINKFINRNNLARTSSTPGKTRTLNFYHINAEDNSGNNGKSVDIVNAGKSASSDKSWFFVDLPGYGFAKVAREIKSGWGSFIDNYLNNRQQLVGIIQIVDIRHAPSKDDVLMQEWLVSRGLPFLVMVTKADKVSRGQWHKHVQIIKNTLHLEPHVPLCVFSAQTGVGKDEVASWIEKCER